MAVYFRKRQPTAADALVSGLGGFLQGRNVRYERGIKEREQSLAEAKSLAEIRELERKTQALSAPSPKDYFRDPYSGRLYPQDPYRGRGTTVNLPFNFNSGVQDQDQDQVFDSPEEADASGLSPGTVVQVKNPVTGQLEDYEI